MSARCQVHRLACSTAWTARGCRCMDCRRWHVGASKIGRQRWLQSVLDEADAAFREDPAYVIAMAQYHHKI